MRKIGIAFILLLAQLGWGQDNFSALVENENTGLPMQSVHVLNLTQVIGTITDGNGVFEIRAQANDTLYFSYLGYKPLKIAVTNDMIRFGNAKFQMTELAFALEEIVVKPYELTGYLDIDVRNAPVNTVRRYSISGLNSGYEGGSRNVSPFPKHWVPPLTRQIFCIVSLAPILSNCASLKKCAKMMKLKIYWPLSLTARF